MAAARKKLGKAIKVTDEVAAIRCIAGDGLIREEVRKDAKGNVVRYNLTYIHFHLLSGDNGRVLGYDTAHGHPHLHFAGGMEAIEPAPYHKIRDRFIAEVDKLKRRRKL